MEQWEREREREREREKQYLREDCWPRSARRDHKPITWPCALHIWYLRCHDDCFPAARCHVTVCVYDKAVCFHLLLSLSSCVSNVLIICQTALHFPLNLLWMLSTFSNAPAIRNASLTLASRSSGWCLLGNLVWVLSLGRFIKAPWIPAFSQIAN